jgi:hypothetical protein
MFLDIIHGPVLSKALYFLYLKTLFQGLDSASVFRQNLLS